MYDTETASQTVVLVVEADPYVRAMAANALDAEGFEVIEAPSADYAAIVLQNRSDVRVLFTEAVTPGELSSFDLSQVALTHDPHIAVIVVAGAVPPGFSGVAPKARFITKPYRMTEVIRLIHKMIADQPL